MKKFIVAILIVFVLLRCKSNNGPSFDKIIFHSSLCFGTCPAYNMEISKNKHVKLFAERVFSGFADDTTKEGYFEGVASDSSFQKLSNIIKTVGLDRLNYTDVACCDGAVKTIIVYYHNKRTYLHSMFLPEKLDPLIQVLYEICDNSRLKRTGKKFRIEGGNSF